MRRAADLEDLRLHILRRAVDSEDSVYLYGSAANSRRIFLPIFTVGAALEEFVYLFSVTVRLGRICLHICCD